jgi:hypothetical protein
METLLLTKKIVFGKGFRQYGYSLAHVCWGLFGMARNEIGLGCLIISSEEAYSRVPQMVFSSDRQEFLEGPIEYTLRDKA